MRKVKKLVDTSPHGYWLQMGGRKRREEKEERRERKEGEARGGSER